MAMEIALVKNERGKVILGENLSANMPTKGMKATATMTEQSIRLA